MTSFVGKFVGGLAGGVVSVFDFNSSALSGAIDIIVVKHKDGSYECSPFHVRFGKLQLLRSKEKTVIISVNGAETPLNMKIGQAGEAFFVEEVEDEVVPEELSTSPIWPSPLAKIPPMTLEAVVAADADMLLSGTVEDPDALLDTEALIPNAIRTHRRPIRGKSVAGEVEEDEDGYPLSDPEPLPADTKKLPPGADEGPLSDGDSAPKYEWEWGWGSLPVRSRGKSNVDNTINAAHAAVEAATAVDPVVAAAAAEAAEAGVENHPTLIALAPLDSSLTFSATATPDMILPVVEHRDDLFTPQKPVQLSSSAPTRSLLSEIFKPVLTDQQAAPSAPVQLRSTPAVVAAVAPRSPSSTTPQDESRAFFHTPPAPLVVPMVSATGLSSSGHSPRNAVTISSGSVVTPLVSAVSMPSSMSMSRVDASRCAHLLEGVTVLDERATRIFEQHRVSFDECSSNPNVLYAADVLYRIENRVFPWQTAIPYLTMLSLFGRSIAPQDIQKHHSIRTTFSNKATSPTDPISASRAIAAATVGPRGSVTSMFSQTSSSPGVLPAVVAGPAEGSPTSKQSGGSDSNVSSPATSPPASPVRGGANSTRVTPQKSGKTGWRAWMPFWPDKGANVTDPAATSAAAGGGAVSTASSALPPSTPSAAVPIAATKLPAPVQIPERKKSLRKSLRPSSDQLAALRLKPGANTVVYSCTSRFQGIQQITSTIYLWEDDTKVIICDIDGTITRSDVLGQVLPIIGRDWSHVGVAQLLSNIQRNGYEVLYLTARAIGQSRITRDYIHKLKQGECSLPMGPVIMTPDSLFQAFNREVIRRRPDEFKIDCLNDIRRLFPRGWNPFYAGFGNRQTDALSYRSVGVPVGKIFIVTHTGELKCFAATFRSYTNINDLVNELFPTIRNHAGFMDENYNEWNFWRAPIEDIE
eukprot:TRINITY_DN5630_c0_g1_i1.p1 TRINITY_DN5630_c0_g1~~TRINITY_DN5630_c0_g1_i1.p1  ORF type:complete len:936 (-),score=191.43 TRINITY_DN5630_c0_g1_i1:154-2919(-)